jgi:hypothetical protein
MHKSFLIFFHDYEGMTFITFVQNSLYPRGNNVSKDEGLWYLTLYVALFLIHSIWERVPNRLYHRRLDWASSKPSAGQGAGAAGEEDEGERETWLEEDKGEERRIGPAWRWKKIWRGAVAVGIGMRRFLF